MSHWHVAADEVDSIQRETNLTLSIDQQIALANVNAMLGIGTELSRIAQALEGSV